MPAPSLLRTPRLFGIRLSPADLPELTCHFADPAVAPTLGGVRSPSATAAWLARELARWVNDGFAFYLFRDPADRRMAGLAGVRRMRIAGRQEIELGYSVEERLWRKGMATEMSRALLAMAEGELGLKGIVAFTTARNLGSQRTLTRLGFRFEKQIAHAGLPHLLYRRP